MKISAKVDYACRALLELALKWPDKNPLRIQIIAERQKIPIKFLTHILINLKEAGCVRSIRGKSGGYVLAKPPAEIELSAVISHFEGNNNSSAGPANAAGSHIMDSIWAEVNDAVLKELKKITLETIAHRYRTMNKTLTFEI